MEVAAFLILGAALNWKILEAARRRHSFKYLLRTVGARQRGLARRAGSDLSQLCRSLNFLLFNRHLSSHWGFGVLGF